MPDHILIFDDGPAEGDTVEMSVEPQRVRWYCQASFHRDGSPVRGNSLAGRDWWVFEEPIVRDHTVEVTKYVLHSSATASPGAPQYHHYRVEDAWGR